MNIQLLRELLFQNSSLDPNDDFGFEEFCKKVTYLLSQDILTTINFFELECTDEELYWLAPTFENIAANTRSAEFISILRSRLAKITPEKYDQQSFKTEHMRKWVDYDEYVRSVGNEIDYAEGIIGR